MPLRRLYSQFFNHSYYIRFWLCIGRTVDAVQLSRRIAFLVPRI
jgi:hypothetical protein